MAKTKRNLFPAFEPFDYKALNSSMKKRIEKHVRRTDDERFRNSEEWRTIRREVIDASGGRCHYCQQTINMVFVDHVIPRSRGGSDAHDNLVACCGSCSARKGSSTPLEWARREAIVSCARNAIAAEFGEKCAKSVNVVVPRKLIEEKLE